MEESDWFTNGTARAPLVGLISRAIWLVKCCHSYSSIGVPHNLIGQVMSHPKLHWCASQSDWSSDVTPIAPLVGSTAEQSDWSSDVTAIAPWVGLTSRAIWLVHWWHSCYSIGGPHQQSNLIGPLMSPYLNIVKYYNWDLKFALCPHNTKTAFEVSYLACYTSLN